MEPFQILAKRVRLVRRKSSKILIASLVALPFLVMTMMVCKQPMWNSSNSATISEAKNVQNSPLPSPEAIVLEFPITKNQSTALTIVAGNKFLGGLFSPEFHEESCVSRYTSYLYYKNSHHKPSSFLVDKLRNYEKLHQYCGPDSKPYKKALKRLLSSAKKVSRTTECNYVVWVGYSGLGNKILSLVSAFLYALLTNRVLLIEQQPDTADLFCEPFPNSSWSLPMKFPLRKKFNLFTSKYDHSYGNLLKKNVISSSSKELKFSSMYLYLAHDADYYDHHFFLDKYQILLREVPWLLMSSDNYFLPPLFLISSFEQDLNKMFPNKETVFHLLSRYLLRPSNQAWGLISRYYKAYLFKADEIIGLQIRVFEPKIRSPLHVVMDQILACTKKEKLLPEINPNATVSFESSSTNQNQQVSKAVLITSLYSRFLENLKNMYWTHPTINGEVVGVYQPSHEEEQKYGDIHHTMQAWVEINLLSMCDVLVASGWSTFGYVAQGLGGLRPWMIDKIDNHEVPNPPCHRVISMEPCYHVPPSFNWTTIDYVRHCEDLRSGIKLVDIHQ